MLADGIEVTVRGPGIPALPPHLRDGVPDPGDRRITRACRGCRGRCPVRDVGVFGCISGFTVEAFDGEAGVATAGHCLRINELDDPTSTSFCVLIHETERRGFWGDAEWKSSSSVDDPAEYYASASDRREVHSVGSYGPIANDSWYCV